MYNKNYKTFLKEIEEHTKILKDTFPTYGLEHLAMSKWPSNSKQCIGSMQFLSKFQWHSSMK